MADLASRAHGVVTTAQLLRIGVTERQIRRAVERGVLLRVYRGVYRVGHLAPSTHADYMAAVLACGDGAVLSGCAAAHLLGIVKGKPPAPEVTVPSYRRVKGIRIRRSDTSDRTIWKAFPS